MDILFAAVIGLFFAASWGFVRLCERLMGGKA
jgi:flagellar biogenesis protein FliO